MLNDFDKLLNLFKLTRKNRKIYAQDQEVGYLKKTKIDIKQMQDSFGNLKYEYITGDATDDIKTVYCLYVKMPNLSIKSVNTDKNPKIFWIKCHDDIITVEISPIHTKIKIPDILELYLVNRDENYQNITFKTYKCINCQYEKDSIYYKQIHDFISTYFYEQIYKTNTLNENQTTTSLSLINYFYEKDYQEILKSIQKYLNSHITPTFYEDFLNTIFTTKEVTQEFDFLLLDKKLVYKPE